MRAGWTGWTACGKGEDKHSLTGNIALRPVVVERAINIALKERDKEINELIKDFNKKTDNLQGAKITISQLIKELGLDKWPRSKLTWWNQ